MRELAPWVSKEVLQRHEEQLKSQVIQVDIKLSQDMSCSQARLYFDVSRPAAFPSRQADLPREEWGWELNNIRTWTLLNPGDAEGYFCCLFPALHVERVDQPIVKPLLVAYKRDSATRASEISPRLLREYAELQRRRQNQEVRKKYESGDRSSGRNFLQEWILSSWWKPSPRPKGLPKHSPSATRNNTDTSRSTPSYRSSLSDNGIYEEPRSYGTHSSREGRREAVSAAGPSPPRADTAPSASIGTRNILPKTKEPGKSSKYPSSLQRAASGNSVDDRQLPQGRHSDRQQLTYGERSAYQPAPQYPEGTAVHVWKETTYSLV